MYEYNYKPEMKVPGLGDLLNTIFNSMLLLMDSEWRK